MAELAISVDGIGKRYVLRSAQGRYQTLRETLTQSVSSIVKTSAAAFRKRLDRSSRDDLFWALRDVSFTVRPGEIIGVIGGNGAGKSTLLKILSRVTTPTTGRVRLRGRLGSLLEVGTGFHPELTGRENIFLNGAILGIRRTDIQRKFDAILAFAEIERFIDMPVKQYSSGMYLRLAFAVAAHLEPDILVIDEVLAVGDAAFQKKCMGRVGEVARTGRTVLFVSHNMAAVQGLCDRVVWLREGRVEQIGTTAAVVSAYINHATHIAGERNWPDPDQAPGNQWIRLHRGRVRRTSEDGGGELSVRTPFVVEIEYWKFREEDQLLLSLNFYNEEGILIFSGGATGAERIDGRPIPAGLLRDECHIPGDLLNDGVHRLELYAMRGIETVFHDPDFLSFTVNDSVELRGPWLGKWPGAVRPHLRWATSAVRSMSEV